MLAILQDLIKSVKNEDPDLYVKIVSGYVRLSRSDYGLLFTADNSGIPYLVCSSGLSGIGSGKQCEFYLENYDMLLRGISENDSSGLPYSNRIEGSSFLTVFRCSFKGILALKCGSDSLNIMETCNVDSLTKIVVSLLDLYHEKHNSDCVIKKYRKESLRKSIYLTGLTNELRTSMNAIAGFAQLIKEPDLKMENISKYVSIISETSENIISKIISYSEIAEIEAGKMKVLNSIIHIDELIDRIISGYSGRFIVKKMNIGKENLLPGDMTSIYGDEAKIRQILDIFLSNALNNTFSGKIIIGSRLREDLLEFSVTDTGLGISKEILDTIFDYKEYQTSVVMNSKGSGLGLFIAGSYARLMGGSVGCESEEGKGSRFYFTIPYAPVSEDGKTDKISEGTGMKILDTGRKKILVAEDDNLNFHLISSFLSKLNVDVIRAENGKQAVDIFKSDAIDLILMDIRMPVMDGYTAARHIREMSADIKIIAQTAYSNDKSVAVSNGCNDFISKPFTRNQLVSLVSSYL